jgi:GNAT superfamily N-acetyltransferase
MNFYNLFVANTVKKYAYLGKKSIWNYIFSGITECEEETKAVELIQEFLKELKSNNEQQDKLFIINKAEEFIKSVERNGFIPRSLFFAIKRFHRWYELNKDADLNAQAEMLYELYETYQLFELEKEHLSTRTIFFLRTAFKNSSDSLKEELKLIAKKQILNEMSNEEAQKHYSILHLLPGLNNAEIFFLTRLSYPHLKPKDTAAMLKAGGVGSEESNLVVQHADEEGNLFTIRSPISPKEISRLQALFLESNLMVHFSPEHRFLVALSERGFIIGGLFYKRADEQTAHMEKIVVSSRYRRKGISEALMKELLSRLWSEHFKFVTTGFFRPEYFYRFGFRIEKKYSGLVADLTSLSNKI